MHELSLVEGMMDIVRESASQNNIKRVTRVKMVIGELTMALPDSLQFAFSVLAQDELFRGAELEIVQLGVICRCEECGNEFKPGDDYIFLCPGCGNGRVAVSQGHELYLDSYEGDEANGPG